ncbi:MAG: MBL fold metallo-hydrolase [Chloroflexi bacterium]|nr:MAG: MBL fold metallo-hydrolase [Chloroflexota bacterium]
MAEFEVTYVSVGHGDATLIKVPGGHYVLVDVYRCPGQGIDLFKLLDDVLPDGDDGRKRLEVLAITHAHDDHIAGIGDLYDRYQIGELWLPQHGEKLQTVAGNYEDFKRIQDEHPEEQKLWPKGSRSVWNSLGDNGEVVVRCFSPPGFIDPEEELDEEEAKRFVHENCVVLKFTYAGYSVMLTGDSNKACWERIVGYYEGRTDDVGLEVLRAESLHASHHGSRTFVKDGEDDEPDLKALNLIEPEHVVISVGPDSQYDHPHDDMVHIYNNAVDPENVLETHKIGTIRLEIESDGVARLITDDGPTYEQAYSWDDDGDDSNGDARTRRRSVPPAAPPPGFERTPQRGPRRDRYAG